jgi:NAD(P)-dependent dehydrogenase (short-subunit alcohol dehydrogenase family)
MTDLKGKAALVADSASGIGRAAALALAGRGACVPVVGREEQRAKDAVTEIEGGGSATSGSPRWPTSNRPGTRSSGPPWQAAVTPTFLSPA